MIEFRCTHCDGVVRAPETHSGKKGRCPTCHEVVPIPEKSERLEPVEFPCEKCGHGMKAPGKFVGRQGKCAKCSHLMTIPPESVPHGEPSPTVPPVAAKPTPAPMAAAPKPAAAPTKPTPAVAPQATKPAPSPFAQPQPAPAQPSPFAQPQPAAHPQPAPAKPNPFAQPQQVAQPRPAAPAGFGPPVANDPFAGLGNYAAPTMAPMAYAPAPSPYAAPVAYGPAPRPSSNSGDPAGVTSMVLGIVSLVFMLGGCCCLPFTILSFLLGTGGLIVGFFGNSGFRVAGIVMSAISLFINVVLIVLTIMMWVFGATMQGMGNYQNPPWNAPYDPGSEFQSDFESEFGNDF